MYGDQQSVCLSTLKDCHQWNAVQGWLSDTAS